MNNSRLLDTSTSIINWSIIIVAASVPLFFLPVKVTNNYPLVWIYLVPKVALLRLGTMFIAGLSIATILVFVIKSIKHGLMIEIAWTDIFLAAFIGMVFLSAQFGLNKQRSLYGSGFWLEGFYTYANYAVLFFAARVFGKADSLKKTTRLLVVTTIVISLYAIIEAYFPAVQNFTNVGLIGRSGATTGNAVILGAYLVLPLLLMTGEVGGEEKSIVWPALTMSALGLGSAAIVFTFSRGAWLGLALAGLLLLIQKVKARLRLSRLEIVAGTAALICAALIVLFGPRAPGNLVARAFSAFNPSEPTRNARLPAWRQAERLTIDFPVFGTGIDNFSQGAMAVSLHKNASFLDKPHNFFLEISATMGIPALVFFLLFVGSIWLGAFKSISAWKSSSGGLAATAGYLIALFFSFSSVNSGPLFYIILGFLAAGAQKKHCLPLFWRKKLQPLQVRFAIPNIFSKLVP